MSLLLDSNPSLNVVRNTNTFPNSVPVCIGGGGRGLMALGAGLKHTWQGLRDHQRGHRNRHRHQQQQHEEEEEHE